jgi:hypothetical protein
VQGWSKVLDMNGFGAEVDYSIYVDAFTEDGQASFHAAFDPLREGWQHSYGESPNPKRMIKSCRLKMARIKTT